MRNRYFWIGLVSGMIFVLLIEVVFVFYQYGRMEKKFEKMFSESSGAKIGVGSSIANTVIQDVLRNKQFVLKCLPDNEKEAAEKAFSELERRGGDLHTEDITKLDNALAIFTEIRIDDTRANSIKASRVLVYVVGMILKRRSIK